MENDAGSFSHCQYLKENIVNAKDPLTQRYCIDRNLKQQEQTPTIIVVVVEPGFIILSIINRSKHLRILASYNDGAEFLERLIGCTIWIMIVS